jgi:ABC-type dipeptide/oligopeptide/nickel transport system ATPase component
MKEDNVIMWKGNESIVYPRKKIVDELLISELDDIRKRVLTKDRDWVCVIDGEEGVGKSVLAQQIAKYLDPELSIDNIVFNSDDFIKQIKDPTNKKGKAIILDEAFNAANARASMSEVNRSLAGVATEMRQKNLFIIIVLPSFFDLDKYFALWRCRTLFHVYFNSQERRRFLVFPKDYKLKLYLNGKKTYDYSKPKQPFIRPFQFKHLYGVSEEEYRLKKSQSFEKRTISNQARKWMQQRNSYIRFIMENNKLSQTEIGKIPERYGYHGVSQTHIGEIMTEILSKEGGV